MRTPRPTVLSLVGIGLCTSWTLAQNAPVTLDGSVGLDSGQSTARPMGMPATYGTAQVSYYVIDSSEMTPLSSGNAYGTVGNNRYLTNVAGLGLVAPMHLPAGALVTYLELDFYDSSNTGAAEAQLLVCDYAGQSCTNPVGNPACPDAPNYTLCSGNAAAIGYGYFSTDMSSNGVVIDNFHYRYFLSVGNTTNDGSTAISQIIVGYKLQVSPAPGVATFNDVPLNDFGFQYIEALAASGITAGCGGGNYCPDGPVTRRQMAIFLAKALGLSFN